MIDHLARDGAKVIAYDIQYTEPTDINDDNALITAVRKANNVVLATTEVARASRRGFSAAAPGSPTAVPRRANSQFPVDPTGRSGA